MEMKMCKKVAMDARHLKRLEVCCSWRKETPCPATIPLLAGIRRRTG